MTTEIDRVIKKLSVALPPTINKNLEHLVGIDTYNYVWIKTREATKVLIEDAIEDIVDDDE